MLRGVGGSCSAGLRRVTRGGIDETSAAKGQDYMRIFGIRILDGLDARRVIFATEGRAAETTARFAADLAEHGGDPTSSA